MARWVVGHCNFVSNGISWFESNGMLSMGFLCHIECVTRQQSGGGDGTVENWKLKQVKIINYVHSAYEL